MSGTSQAERFAQALIVLGEAYGEPVSTVRISAYATALADLDPDAVIAAMMDCLKTAKFFPRPADIRERVLGQTDDRAELAWGAVQRAIKRHGYLREPDLPAETMAAIRDVWGTWQRLCETLPNDGPELLGWRKAFLAAYGAAERRSALALGEGRLESRSQLAPAVRAVLGGAR